MGLIDKIKAVLRINRSVLKSEIEEIKNLKVTEEDTAQANRISVLIAAGMAAVGIPCGALSQQIMARIIAYALRDIKDGVEVHDKLIIKRVINEIQNEKIVKSENLLKELNKY